MNKIELELTKKEYPYLAVLIISTTVLFGLLLHFDKGWFDFERTVIWIGYAISIIILGMVWLDERNIIVFRARKDRLTKCSVCNRSYVVGRKIIDEDDLEPKEQTTTEEKGDKEQTTTITKIESEKDKPLNGIVVNGSLICDNCIDSIREIYKKWQ